MTTDEPRVAILVLNWNGFNNTSECLESLMKISYSNFEIVMIDNGSSDGSINQIKETLMRSAQPFSVLEYSREEAEGGGNRQNEIEFEKAEVKRRMKIIVNKENLGYSGGNNVGIRHVLATGKPKYILILNNDTIVDERFLTELVATAEKMPGLGFLGPKVLYHDFNGKKNMISFAGGLIDMWTGEARHIGDREEDVGQYDVPRYVDYVEGSCIMTSCDAVRRIGVLDPRFFMYWEESDWCIRGRTQGYKSIYVPGSVIWHKLEHDGEPVKYMFFKIRNMFWFMRRNASIPQYILSLAHQPIIFARLASGGGLSAIAEYLKGAWQGIWAHVEEQDRLRILERSDSVITLHPSKR